VLTQDALDKFSMTMGKIAGFCILGALVVYAIRQSFRK
jgi:hypothetical protein